MSPGSGKPRIVSFSPRDTAEPSSPQPPAVLVNPRDFRGSYLPDWLLARPELAPGAKLVYGCLLRHFNKNKKMAWPGQDTIARTVGLSARQVRRHIRTLVEHGLLDVTGTASSNQYRFPWHEWMRGAGMKPSAITRSV